MPIDARIKVVFDPDFSLLDMPYPENSADETEARKAYGVEVPLLLINKNIIFAQQIHSIDINLSGYYPEGQVTVYDNNGQLSLDVTSTNNRLMIAITPADPKRYRKIKIPAYITGIYKWENKITYKWVYKYLPLERQFTHAFTPMNTYLLFKTIAMNTKLGFASTNQVKTVNDKHYRLIQGQNIREFMQEQIKFSGLDENSILDFWIDAWGYLTVINIPYIMSDYDKDYVKLGNETGVNMTAQNSTDPADSAPTFSPIITNSTELGENNITIESYRWINEDTSAIDSGNSYQLYTMSCEGVGEDENKFNMQELQVGGKLWDSRDVSKFEFQKFKFLGVEMDDVPILMQQEIRSRFIEKLNSTCLEITMKRANFGFMRGQQIRVLIYEYDSLLKNQVDINQHEQVPTDIIDDYTHPRINVHYSGFYYIRGMKFIYYGDKKFYKQILYLVPFGEISTPADLLQLSETKDDKDLTNLNPDVIKVDIDYANMMNSEAEFDSADPEG